VYPQGWVHPRIVFPLPDVTVRLRGDYRGHVGTSSSDSSAAPRNGLLKAAIACFVVGVVAVLAIFLTPALTDGSPGLVLYLLTLAWPLGFALAIAFALRSGRRARNGDRT